MNAEFSLVYLTYRPGGLDLLALSLMGQPRIYELIVVDGYQDRVNRGDALRYLQAHGLPIRYYGPPKDKSYPETPVNLANAMNTGALFVRTKWVVYVHDFTIFPLGGLFFWLNAFESNGTQSIISGMGRVRETDPPSKISDISVWADDIPLSNRFKGDCVLWIPGEMENFYCGVPMRFIRQINGFDERADMNISWALFSMVAQAKHHNYRLVVDRNLVVDMVDHHKWSGAEWHHHNFKSDLPAQVEDAAKLAPGWLPVSPNPYHFSEERELVLSRQWK